MKEQLISVLRRDEEKIAEAWQQRLDDLTYRAAMKTTDEPAQPLRLLLRDLVRVLDGKLPATQPFTAGERQYEILNVWRINLCQSVEVFLVGETVVRRWVRRHVNATDSQFLEMFELLNAATHQLVRLYSLRYCENCRALQPTGQTPGREDST